MLSTSGSFRRASVVLFFAATAGPLAGCDSVYTGVKEADASFTVTPLSTGEFSAWTEITIQQSASSVNSATLNALTLDTKSPADTPDLTYLTSLTGSIEKDGVATLAAQIPTFPADTPQVQADIVLKEDLRPYFKNDHTIRLDWAGGVNPNYEFPAGGSIVVNAHILVLIE